MGPNMGPERKNLIAEIRGTAAAGASPELTLRKWRLIHRHVHDHPFATRARLKRSDQWREAANHIRDIGETELLDWALLQAEVADNLERGVQDMRPRKKGSCHALLLEYINNRKRKALAVHKWVLAADDSATATADTLTENILERHRAGDRGGTENV